MEAEFCHIPVLCQLSKHHRVFACPILSQFCPLFFELGWRGGISYNKHQIFKEYSHKQIYKPKSHSLQQTEFSSSCLCNVAVSTIPFSADLLSSEPRVSICTSWSKNCIYEEMNTTPKGELKKHFSLKHSNKTYLSYSAFAHWAYRTGFAETTARSAALFSTVLFSTVRIQFMVPWLGGEGEIPISKPKQGQLHCSHWVYVYQEVKTSRKTFGWTPSLEFQYRWS